VATGLLSTAPSSLCSPEKIVYLSMDTAAALMPDGGVPKREGARKRQQRLPHDEEQKTYLVKLPGTRDFS
jgi:hypothetical protein